MARYSIDGQILTDMANHIRDIKQLYYDSLDFTGENSLILGRTRTLAKTLPAGCKYKVKISYVSSEYDSVLITIRENDLNGAEIYRDTVYNNQISEFVFTSTDQISQIVCSGDKASYNTTIILTIESCDEDGNVNCYFTPQEIADSIPDLSSSGGKQIVLTENQDYGCSGSLAQTYISMYPDKVSTKDITSASHMFYYYQGETIPFELDFRKNASTTSHNSDWMFYSASNLKELPKVNNLVPNSFQSFFYGAYNLREISEEWVNSLDYSYLSKLTSSYSGNCTSIFNNCYSLRKIPMNMLRGTNPVATYSYCYLYNNFNGCFALDDLRGIPIVNRKTATSSNMFSSSLSKCCRINCLTFETDNDNPLVISWKSQTINLASYIGYGQKDTDFTSYNSGITIDKKVTDDASYQALKNDPDWYTLDVNYSRYNKISALETINSLPDTSAYGTNTIKFNGASGAKTDGGAINTLSSSEIAIAAAKGWTVTIA